MYGLFIVCLFGDKDKDSVNTFFSSNNSFVYGLCIQVLIYLESFPDICCKKELYDLFKLVYTRVLCTRCFNKRCNVNLK